MFEEPSAYRLAFLQRPYAGAYAAAERHRILNGGIGERRGVQVAPEEFYGVELRSVWGKPFDSQPILIRLDCLHDHSATMCREAIHEENDREVSMPLQHPYEPRHLRTLDASFVQREEPADAPAVGLGEHSGDTRQGMPVERLAQDGGPSYRCPCRPDGRALRESGLVEETQPRFQAFRVFFTSGQRTRTHLIMAFSSRSMARRAGRWRLQPSERKTRQT